MQGTLHQHPRDVDEAGKTLVQKIRRFKSAVEKEKRGGEVNEEIKDFPVKCQICQLQIPEGMLFFKHPKYGFVCEDCPEFNDGQVVIQPTKG